MDSQPDFDTTVKLHIYETIVATTRPPTCEEAADVLGHGVREIEQSFQRLAQRRMLVLEPRAPSRIRMAPPFSGVATQHEVLIDGLTYYANCAWDALGVAAALHKDADIRSTCADCEEPMDFEVRNGGPVPRECVVHFAVPTAHWWDDVIHT